MPAHRRPTVDGLTPLEARRPTSVGCVSGSVTRSRERRSSALATAGVFIHYRGRLHWASGHFGPDDASELFTPRQVTYSSLWHARMRGSVPVQRVENLDPDR